MYCGQKLATRCFVPTQIVLLYQNTTFNAKFSTLFLILTGLFGYIGNKMAKNTKKHVFSQKGEGSRDQNP